MKESSKSLVLHALFKLADLEHYMCSTANNVIRGLWLDTNTVKAEATLTQGLWWEEQDCGSAF